VDRERERLIQS